MSKASSSSSSSGGRSRGTILALALALLLTVAIFRMFLVGEIAFVGISKLTDCEELSVDEEDGEEGDDGEPHLVSKAPPLSPWAAKNGVIERVDVPKDVELYGGKKGKKCTRPRDSIVRWQCTHCRLKDESKDDNDDDDDNWDCKPLEGKSMCKPLRTWEWDQPWPRSSSLHNPAISTMPLSWQLTYFDPSITYEMANCVGAEEPCFDIHRCTHKEDSPLSVYAHKQKGSEAPKTNTAMDLLTYAAEQSPEIVRIVHHPEDACLLVVTPDSFTNYKHMINAQEWNGGQNHLIWQTERFFGTGGRRPFGIFNFELASMASPLLTEAHARSGYDFVLHFPQKVGPPPSGINVKDLQRKRQYHVAVKGSLKFDKDSTPTMYHQYVWLASEYWPSENADVYVHVDCDAPDGGGAAAAKSRRLANNNDDDNEEKSNAVLYDTTFAFCTGGVGGPMGGDMTGFFFADALVAGAIPVITPELTPPFAPEIDWTPCAIVVSEERIVELPSILRNFYTPEDVEKRREECAARVKAIIGQQDDGERGGDGYKAAFLTALKIWKHRIHVAHIREKMRLALNADIDLEL